MHRITRSQTQRSAQNNAQQNTNPDETISITWCFFAEEDAVFKPRPIEIPKQLYDSQAIRCRRLFCDELREEYKFSARLKSIEFWCPKIRLPDKAEEWEKFLHKSQRLPVPLSSSFSSTLTDVDHKSLVHLIVTAEAADQEGEAHDTVSALREFTKYSKVVRTPGRAPSEGAKSTEYRKVQNTEGEVIHDGRFPRGLSGSTIAPPIQLYHPIFDSFHDILEDETIQPTVKDLTETQEFMKLLSLIYDGDELKRNNDIREHLKKRLDSRIVDNPFSDRTRPDAVLLVNDSIPTFIAEFKRELGAGGSDPSTQAGISMRRSWILQEVKPIREKGSCPTLMLVGGGPWLGVLGGVFTDKVIVQRLTGMQWAGISSTEEDSRVYELARVFLALRKCVHQLGRYYTKLVEDTEIPPLVPDQPHPRYYPYPKSFTYEGGTVEFKYLAALEEDSACVTFQAEVVRSDNPNTLHVGTKIVVKFVARYGEEVHRFLAHQKHAPILYYCGPLWETGLKGVKGPAKGAVPGLCLRSDLMHMVVMEHIEYNSQPELSAESRKQVEDILRALHSNGYVFGDLRMQNILVDSKGKVKLIDFNWCGRYDPNFTIQGGDIPRHLIHDIKKCKEAGLHVGEPYAYYPLSISSSIDWPSGVGPLTAILPTHDWNMFRQLP